MAPTIESILPDVRKFVLTQAAKGDMGFGLSFAVSRISPRYFVPSWQGPSVGNTIRNRFTSGSLKTYRGKVQAALSVLAKEGLMFGRNHPEGGVLRYEHGETDKRFRIRISQKDALKRLSKYAS